MYMADHVDLSVRNAENREIEQLPMSIEDFLQKYMTGKRQRSEEALLNFARAQKIDTLMELWKWAEVPGNVISRHIDIYTRLDLLIALRDAGITEAVRKRIVLSADPEKLCR